MSPKLRALAGKANWFGNGSRILVTTRDSQLLIPRIDKYHVYEVQALDNSEAYELLSKHAFPPHYKLQIKADLVDGVLDHVKGLPLALEVLGSLLCGRRQDEWESTLDNLSRIPKKDINDVLKISYDGLEANEKEIFLHIVCFFKGWEFCYVKKVLGGCDLNAVIGLQILTERSLIRTESGNIQVHDLIQLMGKDIVNQESDYPERRSRLWQYEDVLDVLSRDMGDCDVKAIVLEPLVPIKLSIGHDAFTKPRRLRLLILRNVSFQGPICLSKEE
ncbi:TMV resistance protein N-like [Rhodamnia argentea]|uniref:TMV resistance protein N-like n=1 Tax=Rhodamnia argentea TaxID=178133 RepID=A0ABM3H6C7_9MYRT|nr:TMV resistance protein N-like [Rhodamnia argentea]